MADGQSKTGLKPAIFLDRDGVLNKDPGYVHDPKDLELFPEVPEALKQLKQAGFLLIVISNQSGIGRGMFTSEDTDRFHQAMQTALQEQAGVSIDDFYYCPHAPADACDCRKPHPAMVEQAITKHGVDRNRSWFVGDRDTDIACGLAAGVTPVFVHRKHGEPPPMQTPVVRHLLEFADLVKKKI